MSDTQKCPLCGLEGGGCGTRRVEGVQVQGILCKEFARRNFEIERWKGIAYVAFEEGVKRGEFMVDPEGEIPPSSEEFFAKAVSPDLSFSFPLQEQLCELVVVAWDNGVDAGIAWWNGKPCNWGTPEQGLLNSRRHFLEQHGLSSFSNCGEGDVLRPSYEQFLNDLNSNPSIPNSAANEQSQ